MSTKTETRREKIVRLVKAYMKANRTKKTWEQKRIEARDELFKLLKTDEEVDVGKYVVKKFDNPRTKFDEAKFAKAHPQPYRDYMVAKKLIEAGDFRKQVSVHDNISVKPK